MYYKNSSFDLYWPLKLSSVKYLREAEDQGWRDGSALKRQTHIQKYKKSRGP